MFLNLINMDTTKYLESLIKKINVPDEILNRVSEEQDYLKKELKSFSENIEEVELFGSYRNYTQIKDSNFNYPCADIFIAFKNGFSKKPMELGQELFHLINKVDTNLELKLISSKVIFEKKGIKYELVPAYKQFDKIFIPDNKSSEQKWIFFDLNNQKEQLSKIGLKTNNWSNDIIKLLKFWNQNNGYVFNSYDLENIILNLNVKFDQNIKIYFFSIVTNLPNNGVGKEKIKELNKLKNKVNFLQNLEKLGFNHGLHESTLKEIFNIRGKI